MFPTIPCVPGDFDLWLYSYNPYTKCWSRRLGEPTHDETTPSCPLPWLSWASGWSNSLAIGPCGRLPERQAAGSCLGCQAVLAKRETYRPSLRLFVPCGVTDRLALFLTQEQAWVVVKILGPFLRPIHSWTLEHLVLGPLWVRPGRDPGAAP